MPYTSGSQGADAVTGAKVFMENVLHGALLTAGYTYVEEVANGNVKVRVYKSPAASNFFGQDWYLLVKRTSDASITVDFAVTEQYNSSTHLCFNYGPSATSGLTPTAQYAVNDAAGKAPDNAAVWYNQLQFMTSSFNYYLSITANRMVVGVRSGASASAHYAGLYDDFQPLATSPFPLVVHELIILGGFSARGSATREPNTLAANTNNFRTGPALSNSQMYTTSFTDSYSGRSTVGRTYFLGRSSGYMRGLLRDVYACNVLYGTTGDTLTAVMGGVTKNLVQTLSSSAGTGAFFVDTAI